MTTTRFLPGLALAVLAAGPAFGQYVPRSAAGPVSNQPPGANPLTGQPGDPADGRPMPPPAPPGAADSLNRLTAPAQPGVAAGAPGAALAGQLPPGAYPSPWHADGPGCCGPFGGGPLAYELYVRTGPNVPLNGDGLADKMRTGWIVTGGGKSLFFNPEGSAAWVVDIGLSYTYNRGETAPGGVINVLNKGSTTTNQLGQQTAVAPSLQDFRLRGVHRTSVNFAVGRDWFLWGPGNPGSEVGWNLRVGGDVGGRWGTSHVDLVPTNEVNGYLRRHDVFHGLYGAVHTDLEVPFGGWVWFGGVRLEYGYDWTNLVPPINGDIHNLNILFNTGWRF